MITSRKKQKRLKCRKNRKFIIANLKPGLSIASSLPDRLLRLRSSSLRFLTSLGLRSFRRRKVLLDRNRECRLGKL